MAVTHFRIVEITKVGGVWKELEQTFQTNIIIFLSLNWEPRYLSLKMTQCQNILLKNIVDKSKLFLQMVLMGQLQNQISRLQIKCQKSYYMHWKGLLL